jgi:hypothetical protein
LQLIGPTTELLAKNEHSASDSNFPRAVLSASVAGLRQKKMSDASTQLKKPSLQPRRERQPSISSKDMTPVLRPQFPITKIVVGDLGVDCEGNPSTKLEQTLYLNPKEMLSAADSKLFTIEDSSEKYPESLAPATVEQEEMPKQVIMAKPFAPGRPARSVKIGPRLYGVYQADGLARRYQRRFNVNDLMSSQGLQK